MPPSREEDDLYKLEKLSLVSKVTKELLNNIGIEDTTAAEFIISLHEDSPSLDQFKSKVTGLGISASFAENLDRLIVRMHPKHTRQRSKAAAKDKGVSSQKGEDDPELARTSRMFPGLAIPDSKPDPLYYEDRQGDAGSQKPRKSNAVDDFMQEFSDLASASRLERSGKRGRSRSRSPPPRYARDRGRDPRSTYRPPEDDRPILFKIYDAHVTNLKDFGAFVSLEGVRGRHEGLVHISAIVRGQRLNHPSDVLSRGQSVKVKVLGTAEKLKLSMSDVDQSTGRDLTPHLRIKTAAEEEEERALVAARSSTGANAAPLGRRGAGGGYDGVQPTPPPPPQNHGRRKRLTSPERWELKQLIASGVADPKDYPELAESEDDFTTPGARPGMDANADDELDIEVNEKEAPFLAGQTNTSLEMSPVKIIRAPDGTLNRAAMQGASLAKERREMRQQELQDQADAQASDLSAWHDPMAHEGAKMFAQDIKGSLLGQQANNPPEWKKQAFNKATTFGKITNQSIQEQRESLPIFKLREPLLQAVREHNVLVVVGDTGSGKTTQMTQYLAEAGFADNGRIGCTQPRRVAAVSVAKRVAEEVGVRVGQEVGYNIRFEDVTSSETKIKYMTDGMLQREALIDPDMSQYSVIILDEAHERTIATDVLFGLLKKTLKRRSDFKLIVTSATLDAEKFSKYFFNCPIFTIPGRTFPVEVLYTKEPESDYLDAALITVMQIHLSEPAGDILVFLTGQEEIDTASEILFERMRSLGNSVPELVILPVYSALPSEMQSRIFEPAPPGARKVVLATNIAETSITIDGVYYVVDPGFVKQNAYDPRLGMDSLVVTPISQAQARQRAGRAGRTGPGKCYRLYTEAAYKNEMLPNPIPDIQRQNLSSTILLLKAMGVNDLLHFDFMDPPPHQTMLTALESLYALSALDDEGLLTRLGRKMADFPMEPQTAKMLISSIELGCSEEILSIVAMLSVQNIFYRPKDKQSQADAKKARCAYCFHYTYMPAC